MDLGLAGRVYIVTGGTRGLGRATVEALVGDGAAVVVSARTAAAVDDLGTADADRILGLVADNADPQTPARLIAAAQERFGRLDGALISVGGPPPGSALDSTDADWSRAFESVFLGGLRLAREIGRVLDEGGSIALVLSSSVRSPIPNLAISNGLRPGLAMLAKNLSDELGPRGVRVNGLLPGRLATERIVELDQASGDADAARAEFEEQIPLRRYGTPEEFGRVAAFVLSPAASYVSGVMLPVDGGMLRCC